MGELTSGRHTAWAIINPWGDIWTPTTFWTEAEARKYLADFWQGNKKAPNLSEYTFEKVRVTVTRLRQTPKPAERGAGDGLASGSLGSASPLPLADLNPPPTTETDRG